MLTHEDYKMLFHDALERNEVIMLFCRCTVRYSGKAESYLERGDRIILLKADKTLLVHQPEGNNPINYMKAGTEHSLVIEHGTLWLRSKNPDNKDFMDVEIHIVHSFQSHKLEDGATIDVKGTEKDMSDMLASSPHMIEEGFVPVSREEQTVYGFIDVLGVDKQGVLTVIECKRIRAELSAVTQLRRYVEKLRASKGLTGKIRGIIAAPAITGNAEQMLKDWGFEYKLINPPHYHERFDKKQRRLDGFTR